ncbi:hypothetical protein BBK82_16005 [Lentzea guizhouensis]|uniref:Uncharacterized protein n=1 Tax=Lentzea guizhouensis TaxID=1586287 RepID=A0A1B2HHY3_9PSEU|nr:hypothetical protein [Lentzea guizhouensis]ANZ37339.1 hypothetical protein BBK82_16005 [Lentzea guizhouensis]
MRKLAAVLAGCLLLAGCGGSSWEGQLRYKIASIDKSTPTEFFQLELVGDAPEGLLWQDGLTPKFLVPGNVSGDAAVGDEVVCTGTQKKGSPFASWEKGTELSGCRKA